jgi:glycosyltransferase involved in cell wall biosynthesis
MLDPHAMRAKGAVKKRLYLALFERTTLKDAAMLHFTSAEEQKLAASMGIGTRGFVVPNGLDLAAFPDAPGGELDRVGSLNTILFLSRLNRKKGLDLLIPAFARVVAARPDARLLLAGPDNDGYLSIVEGLIWHHGLQDSVRYVGMLLAQKKLDALRNAACLVLPSYSENFGLVVIEALACGTPVVMSDRVNIWTDVVEAGAGLVIPCDVPALANAMLEMLGDPSRMREMGQRGRELVERNFAWDPLAEKMLDAYLRILRRSNAAEASEFQIVSVLSHDRAVEL